MGTAAGTWENPSTVDREEPVVAGGVGKAAMRNGMRLAVWLYRRTGGSVGGKMRGAPVLLLTTTGRRTGRTWTTPVMYRNDEDRLVIVASNGGADRHPAWWLNLRANPRATVQIGKESFPVTATETTAEERERLWPLVVETYGGYADYEKKTVRRIPVVLLERS
jgi:deazaflavin-dependent oxidoreductase (nitroreductase family)